MKSSIDWCEHNYTRSSFIAEFWNSLTGLALCISSILFYINNKHIYNLHKFHHIKQANNLLFIVGIGTILFHGTLL